MGLFQYVSEDVWNVEIWKGKQKLGMPTVRKGSRVTLRGQPYTADGHIWQGIWFRSRIYEIWIELLVPKPPLQEIEFAQEKPTFEVAGRAAKS